MTDLQSDYRLVRTIRNAIEASSNQAISFHEYMALCLYHSEYGYYMSDRLKVGKKGDFYTSSSIGSIMGEVLAHKLIALSREFGQHERIVIAEWGGGNGQLALHVLDTIHESYPEAYNRLQVQMIEQSPFHRQLQQETLCDHFERIVHYDEQSWFQQASPNGIVVFSNELLDAFPVHRVKQANGAVQEIFVAWDEQNDQFQEVLLPISDSRILTYIERHNIVLREGQIMEVHLDAAAWMRKIGNWMDNGVVLSVDYGDTVEQLVSPHRYQGTLMCYRNHQAHDNPYLHPGEQDITAHVNFTAMIEAGLESGLAEWILQTQQDFLVAGGILELLQDHTNTDPFSPIAKRNRAIRQLLVSDQMSQLFKVLIQKKKK